MTYISILFYSVYDIDLILSYGYTLMKHISLIIFLKAYVKWHIIRFMVIMLTKDVLSHERK
jgi:hypothetical protein